MLTAVASLTSYGVSDICENGVVEANKWRALPCSSVRAVERSKLTLPWSSDGLRQSRLGRAMSSVERRSRLGRIMISGDMEARSSLSGLHLCSPDGLRNDRGPLLTGGENSYSCDGEAGRSGDIGGLFTSETASFSGTSRSASSLCTRCSIAEEGRTSSTGALAPRNTSCSADSPTSSRGKADVALSRSILFLAPATFERCRLFRDLGDDIDGADDCVGNCSTGGVWKVTMGSRRGLLVSGAWRA
jgi:hypothetical protein